MYFSDWFVKKLFRIGILFVALLVLLDLITYFFYPSLEISKIFLATREQTPLTWVSSTVLLLVAFSSVTAHKNTKDKKWYFISLIFFFLSMDDATYFHERFSAALQKNILIMQNFPSYSWIVIYFPILLFGVGTLFYLLWKNSDKKNKKLLKVAFLLLGFSLFLDMLDGWVGKSQVLVFCFNSKCSLVVAHLMRLTEEVFEIVGIGILGFINIKLNALKD